MGGTKHIQLSPHKSHIQVHTIRDNITNSKDVYLPFLDSPIGRIYSVREGCILQPGVGLCGLQAYPHDDKNDEDNGQHEMVACYVTGSPLRASCALSCSRFTLTPQGRYYHYYYSR